MKVTATTTGPTFEPITVTLVITDREDALRLVHMANSLASNELINDDPEADFVLNEKTAEFITDVITEIGEAVQPLCQRLRGEAYPDIYVERQEE